jgi:diguanylate cyclase (GGDEF)-like protein
MEEFDHKITTFGIRNRILVFTLIVTLVPLLGLGWAFYTQTKNLLQDKVELELHNISHFAQREAELWFKESAFNVRVFSNSFVISENLEHFITLAQSDENQSSLEIATTVGVISEYLMLVQSQFQEYQRLLLLDDAGEIIAQSTQIQDNFMLPDDWEEQIAQTKMVIGETERGSLSNKATFIIATPVFSGKQQLIGLLAAESSITGLESLMQTVAHSESIQLSLLGKNGSILSSTIQGYTPGTPAHLGSESLAKLYNNPMHPTTYISNQGDKVIGIFSPLPRLSWGIMMEKSYDLAFAEVMDLKNITLTIIAILLSIVAIAAFFLSYSILSPLKTLINGAIRVANGDLNVKLPIKQRDELGVTISVFNDMVVRLQKTRKQLEKLATIDSLTGLFNRKYLMESLALHVKRFTRHQTPFSILMADLDHFKKVNDRFGHLAGDAVLVKIAEVFNDTLRSIDIAGRYGGEEFLIILENTQEQEARQTAERIRQAVENSSVTMAGEIIKVTISIGIATSNNKIMMNDGQLIGLADKALYEAKQNGRNRTVSYSSTSTDYPKQDESPL